jgi:BirA family biotin operon repressor/biotin-[acetyl-CoA-carboxylase] ligase
VGLKWPNDLYLGPRKAGGILIQNSISGAFLQSSVVGIGLNVNQLEFDPALPNPTSLAAYLGQPFDLDAVADRLFECLERRYLQLKSGQHAAIKAEYEQSLFRLGEPAQFVRSADDTSFEGIIRGVTESGRLRIQTAAGEEVFDLKEVRYLL